MGREVGRGFRMGDTSTPMAKRSSKNKKGQKRKNKKKLMFYNSVLPREIFSF